MDIIEVIHVRVADFQVWPEMAAETFEQLVTDIRANGVLYPIILDADFTVIDGHHRLKAAKQVGLERIPCIVRQNLSADQKLEIAHKANATTRTLTAAVKKARAIELRKQGKSFRQIAEWLGVGKSTVDRWIKSFEQGVPPGTKKPKRTTETVKGSDGKEYPSQKPKTTQQEFVESLQRRISELESSEYALKTELRAVRLSIRELGAESKRKDSEIARLRRELEAEKINNRFSDWFGGGGDNGLEVFASMVGLNDDATVEQIDRAFRRARAKAHPDNTKGDDWLSKRYNTSYDMFKRLYRVS
ncbi:ParB N-terminal domain-containing protein [Bacillus sp. FJAT-52991]|uniref:ParB N-terminal domain-containing protein n=1 Tax=Bacillus kandeliae TaxID=3129297 RepID=A0ABZ2N8A9_9BACI